MLISPDVEAMPSFQHSANAARLLFVLTQTLRNLGKGLTKNKQTTDLTMCLYVPGEEHCEVGSPHTSRPPLEASSLSTQTWEAQAPQAPAASTKLLKRPNCSYDVCSRRCGVCHSSRSMILSCCITTTTTTTTATTATTTTTATAAYTIFN